ncbi:MAG: hypothetical protein ACQCN6_01325 [Candidatus Bathyarchaeia archaeon]|jgi:hypothetical protein
MEQKEDIKEQIEGEVRESLERKLVLRREAPFIGLASFAAALWGAKLYTSLSAGSGIVFQLWGYNIHFHHFNYGLIFVIVGLMLTFFEGPWFLRVQHLLFGAGIGLIVDEYWLLLTFDEHASNYFSPESQFISLTIGAIITVVYAVIAVGVFFKSKKERKLWRQLYEEVKTGKING